MKFKVFGEAPEEPEVFLKLVQAGDSICLVACDDKGASLPAGQILTIRDRIILVANGLCDEAGLRRDLDGHAVVKFR